VTRKRTKSARYLLFGVSASLIVALDQLTKFWAEANLVGQGSIPVIGELLQFRLAYNNAAAFSLGVGATWVLTTISLAASIALIAPIPAHQDHDLGPDWGHGPWWCGGQFD
jgi:signal peptidase II